MACRRAVGAAVGPVITPQRGPKTTAVSIVNWFAAAFRTAGLEGCSSHSGRRTFITRAARVVHQAGHRCATSIQMTQRYIDSDTEAQRKPASLSDARERRRLPGRCMRTAVLQMELMHERQP
jgi:integrase